MLISWPEFQSREAFATMLDAVADSARDLVAVASVWNWAILEEELDANLARWADDGGR